MKHGVWHNIIPVSVNCFHFLFIDKATSPSNAEEDWEAILAFCDQINKELEGPQISVRLLSHKIQSPQSKEALYALTVSVYEWKKYSVNTEKKKKIYVIIYLNSNEQLT